MGLKVHLIIKSNTLIVRLSGEMDQHTSKDFRTRLNEVLNTYDVKSIVFNFKELSFMDSTGIGIILGRYNYIKSKGGKIFITDCNKEVTRIINITGLYKICTILAEEIDVLDHMEVA